MARLNARQRRAHKLRVALNELAQSRNVPIVDLSGDIRANITQVTRKPTYTVAAVRPTIVTGKRKSGKGVTTIGGTADMPPDKVIIRPAPMVVRPGSPKLKLVAPKEAQLTTLQERRDRASRLSSVAIVLKPGMKPRGS